MCAIAQQHTTVARALLEAGADVNIADNVVPLWSSQRIKQAHGVDCSVCACVRCRRVRLR